MATKLTANGVTQPQLPALNNTRCFTPATVHGERNTINTITATLMENCSPAWLEHSKSAENSVTSGSTRINDISQVVI